LKIDNGDKIVEKLEALKLAKIKLIEKSLRKSSYNRKQKLLWAKICKHNKKIEKLENKLKEKN